MAGVDISDGAGDPPAHKSITMTQPYAHLSPEHKKAAIEALGNALKGEGQKAAKTA